MQDTNDTFAAARGSTDRARARRAAGVAAASRRRLAARGVGAAATESRRRAGEAPRRAVHVRYGRAARHQGVDRRARPRASVQPRVPAERRRAGHGALREPCGSSTAPRVGANAHARTDADRRHARAQTLRGSGCSEVALHPKFAQNRLVYFSYNKTGEPIPDANPPRRQAAVALGARQVRRQGAHGRRGALRRGMVRRGRAARGSRSARTVSST